VYPMQLRNRKIFSSRDDSVSKVTTATTIEKKGENTLGFKRTYDELLRKYPRLVNCASASAISGCADLFKQVALYDKSFIELDFVAMFRLMIFMFFFVTPMNMTIYYVYDRLRIGTLSKLIIDQAFMCWVTNPLQMSVMHVLVGHPIELLYDRIFSQELVKIVKASWFVWIPAKFLMFAAVPRKYTILFQSAVSFMWQIYLSMQYNK